LTIGADNFCLGREIGTKLSERRSQRFSRLFAIEGYFRQKVLNRCAL
jgi:hypothetical protein